MVNQIDTPAPREFETKADFLARWNKHPTVMRHFPSAVKRRVMGERRWSKAKSESLVSITTGAAEVLLFGRL